MKNIHRFSLGIFKITLITCLLLTFYGCVNLTGVRDFSNISAKTADYQGITRDFVATLDRRAVLRPPGAPEISSNTKVNRKEIQKRMDADQQVLVKYMEALDSLSSNDIVLYNTQLDSLEKALNDAKIGNKDDISMYKASTNVIARLFTDLYRQNKLKEIIPKSDPFIQKSINLMQQIIKDEYLVSINNEREQITSFFGKIDASAKERNVDGLSMLANISQVEMINNLKTKEDAANNYLKILDKISQGHKQMTSNISQVSSEELRTELLGYKTEIQKLYTAIRKE
jgi:hypothetical protein